MTALVDHSGAIDADRAGDDQGGDANEPFEVARGLDLAATVALLAYSIAVAVGFSRVFVGHDFLRDLVLIAVIGHGTSYLLRLLRVPAFVAIPLVLVVLTWTVAWIYYPATFSGPFPLSATWETVRADFHVIQSEFQTATAPVPYSSGWAFVAGATMAAVVWLADTFAFRAQARGEALVPGAVLFVFIAALGVDENRVACSLLVIGTGFVALAVLRLRVTTPGATVLGNDRHPLARLVVPLAGATAIVLAGAWAIAPHLPGAEAEPWFDTHSDRGGVTEIISPLVDIRSAPRQPGEHRAVHGAAPTPPPTGGSSALPRFDGDTWDLPESILDDTHGALEQGAPGSVENHQVITIDGLRGALVPAAPNPVSARGLDGYNSLSASLVKTDSPLESGDMFDIVSAMPRFDADALRNATSDSPPDDIFLELPDDLPPVIAETATAVTAGAPTNFDKMLMLQNWFRDNFTYDTNVPPGNGSSAIVSFLENKVGYCEQFAGTFAAMARTLGMPARVAVGFTQGEQAADGTYKVLGRNAHAWPEIWFDGFGWVPFEPTPGRGLPGAEAYTGVPPQQDTGATTTTTTTTHHHHGRRRGGAAGDAASRRRPSRRRRPTRATPRRSRGCSCWRSSSLVALLAALPALVRRWRRRHHGSVSDPAHLLAELWDRALHAVGAAGVRTDPALTPLEQSARVARTFPGLSTPLHELAEVATAATYATSAEVSRLADDSIHRDDGPYEWCALIEDTRQRHPGIRRARVRRYFTVWH